MHIFQFLWFKWQQPFQALQFSASFPSPAVRSSLCWSGCGCFAVGSSSFAAFSPAAPIATLAPHGCPWVQWLGGCSQRANSAHFSEPKKGGKGGKNTVEARPNKKDHDYICIYIILLYIYTYMYELMSIGKLLEHIGTYLLYLCCANPAGGCFYVCDVQKMSWPNKQPLHTLMKPAYSLSLCNLPHCHQSMTPPETSQSVTNFRL